MHMGPRARRKVHRRSSTLSSDLNRLEALGLSHQASQVYVTLVRNFGDYTLDELSTICQLELEMLQPALEELIDKGFVKVERNRFSAVQPRRVLRAILEEEEKKLERRGEELRSRIAALERSLEPVYWEVRVGIRPEELLEPLESLSSMELRTAQMISKASEEVLISAGRFDWYDKVREVLLQALDRGAKAKILMHVSKDDATRSRAEELRELGIEVREPAEEWYPVRGTLVDRSELVFVIWATRREERKRPVYFKPHYTKNPGMVKVFLDAFENRWRKARGA